MKHTEPAKRWGLVKQTRTATKSVSFMGDAMSHRNREPEIVLEHLAILMENDRARRNVVHHPGSYFVIMML